MKGFDIIMRYLKSKNLLLIISIYTIITIFIIIKNNSLYTNIINPLFWSFIIVYLLWYIKHFYIRFSGDRKYLVYIIIISFMYVVAYFYLGFIFGFSKSPYNHDIASIFSNIITQFIPIIGVEMVRGVLVIQNKDNKPALIYTTIVLILIGINYDVYAGLFSNKEQFFKYNCSYILPSISLGILYTYLTRKGSFLLSLIFRLFNRFFVIVLPILPNIDWFITGSIYILSPVFIYILFKYKFIKEKQDIRKKHENLSAKISYIITLALAITLICFMLGTFKYEPITILTNSMSGTFDRGDVIIYRKLTDEELKKIPLYSIIVYSIGDQYIAHRVVSIQKENDNISYQTKGDNNNVCDKPLVYPNQIKGVYTFCVKYVGFPSIWLYEYFNKEWVYLWKEREDTNLEVGWAKIIK